MPLLLRHFNEYKSWKRFLRKRKHICKWYWLEFVEEDGWKLDLEASSFLNKAELPTTNLDELFFELLDFADRFEK